MLQFRSTLLEIFCNKLQEMVYAEINVALQIAIQKGDPVVTKKLILAGSNLMSLEAKSGSLICLTLTDVAEIGGFRPLMDHGAIADRFSALPAGDLRHPATWKERFETIRLLLSFGASPNASDATGCRTPLTEAISSLYLNVEQRLQLLQLLLDYGANVIAKSKTGGLLEVALTQGRDLEKIVPYLLDHGVDVNTLWKIF
jgi:hypothetical protein